MRSALVVGFLLLPFAAAAEPVAVACNFKRQPLMVLMYRGGMGAGDNTLHIAGRAPVSLASGSSLSSALVGGKDYAFNLRPPVSLSINGRTFPGTCVSTLQ